MIFLSNFVLARIYGICRAAISHAFIIRLMPIAQE